ncbi:MAG: hypothetical protein ACKO6N_27260 [Myxococcota bacterium]
MQYPMLLRTPARVQAHVGVASHTYYASHHSLLRVSCFNAGRGQDTFSRVLAAFTRQEHSLKGRLKLGLSLARHHMQEPMRWLRQTPLSYPALLDAAQILAHRQPHAALVLEHVAAAENPFIDMLWELIARPGEFPLPLYLIFNEGWPESHPAELLKTLVLTHGLAALTVAPALVGTHPLEEELIWFSRWVEPEPSQTPADVSSPASSDGMTTLAAEVSGQPEPSPVEEPTWEQLMADELKRLGIASEPVLVSPVFTSEVLADAARPSSSSGKPVVQPTATPPVPPPVTPSVTPPRTSISTSPEPSATVLALLETAQALEEQGEVERAIEHYLAASLLAQDQEAWSVAKRCVDGGLALARMSPSTHRRLQLELLLGRARVAWAMADSREAVQESGAAQWYDVARQRMVESDPPALQALVRVTGAGIMLEVGSMKERWQVRRELLTLGLSLEQQVETLANPGLSARQITLADSGEVRQVPLWEPVREQHRLLARALELLAQAEVQLSLQDEALSHLDLALKLRRRVQDEAVVMRLERLWREQLERVALMPSASSPR